MAGGGISSAPAPLCNPCLDLLNLLQELIWGHRECLLHVVSGGLGLASHGQEVSLAPNSHPQKPWLLCVLIHTARESQLVAWPVERIAPDEGTHIQRGPWPLCEPWHHSTPPQVSLDALGDPQHHVLMASC